MPAEAVAGVVAAGHRESARAGARALARGGNAVDAACAAAFMGAVVESALTGLGAGGFLLARSPEGEVTMLDFFVGAPGLGPGGDRLDPAALHSFTVRFGDADQIFHIGPASVAVPGMAAGLGEANRTLGRLPLEAVVMDAIEVARRGAVITPEVAYLHTILGGMLTHTPEARRIYAPRGDLLGRGDVLRMPELADSLAHLAQAGPDTLRDGELAGLLVDHMRRREGYVTATDLREYAACRREPLRVDFRDVELVTNPPPSTGGLLIAAALRAMGDMAPATAERDHYLATTRAGLMANALRSGSFDDDLRLPDAAERLWARMEDGEGGEGAAEDRKPAGSTTHVSAIDADGGMASMSSSNGSGSGVVVPETGIMLNNMMGEQDLNPGGFGLIEPGRRMTSMMAPTLLLRDGRPLAGLGAAGSNRLRSAILQTVVSMVDGGLDVARAVQRPRVHPEDGGVDVEAGVPEAAVEALAQAGHTLRRWGGLNLFFGGVSIVAREREGLAGAGDPRRGGAAALATHTGEVIDL